MKKPVKLKDANGDTILVYQTGGYEIAYPVGEAIHKNMDYIIKLGNAVLKIIPKNENITLWCSGSSGAIIAALVCSIIMPTAAMVKLNHVKKDGESHHGSNIYSPLSGGYSIIVDDFIGMGTTMKRIFKQSGNVYCIGLCGGWSKRYTSDMGFLQEYKIKSVICTEIY